MKLQHLQNSYTYRKYLNDDLKRLINKIDQIKQRKNLHGIDLKLPKVAKKYCNRGQSKQRKNQVDKQNKRLTQVIQTTMTRPSQYSTQRSPNKNSYHKNNHNRSELQSILTNQDQFMKMSNSIFIGKHNSPVLKKKKINTSRNNYSKMKTTNQGNQDMFCFFN